MPRDWGVDRGHVCPFDYAVAQLSANEFVSRILHDGLAVRWLLVGDHFRFGARRSGDFTLLKALALQFGFVVEAMASVVAGGGPASRIAIRARLETGDLSRAQPLLRP